MAGTTFAAVVRVVDLPAAAALTGAELMEVVQTSAGVGQSVQVALSNVVSPTLGALPTGGGTSQILAKSSNSNYSAAWYDLTSFISVISTTGLATSGSGTALIISIGTAGISSTQIATNAVGTAQLATSIGLTGSLSVGGLLTVVGTATVTGTAILNGGLQVVGTSIFTGLLTVSGTATLTSLGTGNLISSGTGVVSAPIGQLYGTNTSDNATTGNIGEYIEAKFTPTTGTVTITIASPAVITWPTPPYSGSGTWTAPIVFTTTGSLPTGITASTVYWVIGSSLSGNTFQIATSVANALAGTAINTSGTQSGTQTGNTLQPLTNNTPIDACAISISAGDWDISAVLYGDPTNASTSVTDVSAYISLVLNTPDTTPGRFAQIYGAAFVPGASAVLSASIPPARFSLSGVATIHLVGLALFTVSTMSMYAIVRARRVR